MITKTINLYSYDELSEKVKEKVLNDYRSNNNYDFLEEDITEYLKELLTINKIGFDESLKVGYSLSNCQGDGFNFTGEVVYKNMVIKLKQFDSHYQHSNTVSFEYLKFNHIYAEELTDKQTEKANKLLIEFENLFKSICRDCEKYGYNFIESEDSKDNIRDNLNANEYTFRENGTIEHI